MRLPSLFRWLAAPVAAIALLASSNALAARSPAPVMRSPADHDTTGLGFISHVQIGTAACDTCPPRVCPGESFPVTISGFLPSSCYQFRGFTELPVAAPFTVLMADFVVDTCGVACPLVLVPFSASVSLPAPFANSGMFLLRHQVRSCEDTLTAAEVLSRQYTFAIEPNCVVPPPLDSLVRSFVSFEVTPARRCPGDTLALLMRENGCPPCVNLSSFSQNPDSGFQAEVTWQPMCAEFRCDTDSLSVAMGAFAAGSHAVFVNVDVRVLGTENPDSTISFVQRVDFEVPQGCNGAPCVEGHLPARDLDNRECAATIPPGGTDWVTLDTRTGLDIWGAQGSIGEFFPLRILDVEYAGSAPGTFVTWNRVGQEVRFIVFTTGNQPIVPSGKHDFLRVRLSVDRNVGPEITDAHLRGGIELAAGQHGENLPPCIEFARLAPPALRICIQRPADSCDANGDGRTDVRDLVRMIAVCVRGDSTTDRTGICRDCDSNGHFDISDVFCCARHILRSPNVPRDSTHASSTVQVSFGELRRDGARWLVPVRVTGANALAGTLLRMHYPAERWRAEIPIYPLADAIVYEGWMPPFVDVDDPGVVTLGWLKIGEGEAAELSFELALRPLAEALSGDAITMEGADLVLPDGTTLRPEAALPSAPLLPTLGPPPGDPAKLELGPARPNPFTGTTRFSVSLPRESMVELTVHDVAGRVVATLARGRFAAGVRDFEWNGSNVNAGVYFARLNVDGQVFSRRLALLRAGR